MLTLFRIYILTFIRVFVLVVDESCRIGEKECITTKAAATLKGSDLML
jgi:hypothetical protein